MATMVTRTRLNITLQVHCLSSKTHHCLRSLHLEELWSCYWRTGWQSQHEHTSKLFCQIIQNLRWNIAVGNTGRKWIEMKKKTIPVEEWTSPEVSRRLMFPDLQTIATHEGVVKLSALSTGRLYRPGNIAGRVQLKCDGTRWRTGGEVKGKLANGVGSQYSSHYLGTWCIQHYYRWCAHLGCQ
jgi:hypothetical protein